QTLFGEVSGFFVVEAVELLNGLGFALQIERLRSGHLHAIGHLETFDAGGQLCFTRILLLVMAVELVEEIDLGALLSIVHLLAPQQIINGRALGIEGGALENTGQESGPPVGGMALWDAPPK